jgi:hypothetical protein
MVFEGQNVHSKNNAVLLQASIGGKILAEERIQHHGGPWQLLTGFEMPPA